MANGTRRVSMSEASLISGLERVIPGYVMENNPNLINHLSDTILENYVVIDKEEIVKNTFQTGALKFPGVKRGDIITAELMNRIIRGIENLDERVTALESKGTASGAPVITEIIPTGQVRIGQEITVKGIKFMPENKQPIVTIGGTRIVKFKKAPEDMALVFNIPPISGVPDEFQLTVNNGYGTAVKTVVILPKQVKPVGRLIITNETTGIETFEVGKSYDIWFKIDSQTTIEETYGLEAIFYNHVGDLDTDKWKSSTYLIDAAGAELSSRYIEIYPGNPVLVGAHITIPDGAQSVDLVLYAKSLHNEAGLSRGSTSVHIEVGESFPISDPRVTFTLERFGSAGQGRIRNIDGVETIEIPYNGDAKVRIMAHFDEKGYYEFSTSLENTGNNYWTIGAPQPKNKTFEETDENLIIKINLELQADQSRSMNEHPEKDFMLIEVVRKETAGSDKIESFHRVPIRGYTP